MRSTALIAAVVSALWCAELPATTDDPMRPVTRPGIRVEPDAEPQPARRPDWVLSSTLVSELRRVAVINDRLVGVGDSILGARVVGIGARSARLRYAGQEFLLQLGTVRVDKRSADSEHHWKKP